jgi:flagellar basal body-associated protein FliL
MDADFAEIIKRTEQGGDKEAKKALAKAVKMRFAEKLKNANEKERPFTKAYLAQMLHEKSRFDLALSNKTLDTLCTALFNEQVSATPPELAPYPQAVQRLATEPTNKKAPRCATGKWTYILLIIILILLIVIAAGVLYLVLYTKPEMPPVQESTTEQEVLIELDAQTRQMDTTEQADQAEQTDTERDEQEAQTDQMDMERQNIQPETPPVQEFTSEQEAQTEQEIQPEQTNPDGDENE